MYYIRRKEQCPKCIFFNHKVSILFDFLRLSIPLCWLRFYFKISSEIKVRANSQWNDRTWRGSILWMKQ